MHNGLASSKAFLTWTLQCMERRHRVSAKCALDPTLSQVKVEAVQRARICEELGALFLQMDTNEDRVVQRDELSRRDSALRELRLESFGRS